MRFALATAALVLSVLAACSPSVVLNPGDLAPDFALPGSDGQTHRLSELKGRTVVVAWFPKSFTGG